MEDVETIKEVLSEESNVKIIASIPDYLVNRYNIT